MNNQIGIPKGALIAINDLLDNCAKIQPGQEVLILAHLDGLYGGDNLVDQEAMAWIQAGVQARGANASLLWIDEPAKPHAWRFPPIAKGAIGACDVLIMNSFDIVTEENVAYRDWINAKKIRLVRNFATTAPLLCSNWAQTPYELVSEIRYQATFAFKIGLPWKLTDENGTNLEGVVAPSDNPAFPSYSVRRDIGYYNPWPEWVHPPVVNTRVNGIFIFDCMLSWWSRYIGISPYFEKPIRMEINNCRITKIEGGAEAEALRSFLASMQKRIGEGVYDFNTLHFGVHPQAFISEYQCPSLLYRRVIEHSQSRNIHVHIGASSNGAPNPAYPYWMHITGDIRNSTFVVGNTTVYDKGHLTTLDNPVIQAIAAKYPDRPGLKLEPRSY
jgi:hypothetical protein